MLKMNYPKYSDLIKITSLQKRITEIQLSINNLSAVSSGSLIRTGHTRSNTRIVNVTEKAAMKLVEYRETLKILNEEYKLLYLQLREEIQAGNGDETTKELIHYYYLCDIPVKKAAVMAGVKVKHGKQIIEEYTRAARDEEEK